MDSIFPPKRWNFKPPLGVRLRRGHPLAVGMNACWLINAGAGNTIFDLEQKTNGTLSGGVSWTASEKGSALSFNKGSSQTVNFAATPSVDIVGPISVTMWLKITSAPANTDTFLARGYDSGPGNIEYVIDTDGTNLRWFKYSGAGVNGVIDVPLPSLNVWHHIVGSADGTYWKLYIDGVLKSTSTNSTLPASSSQTLGWAAMPNLGRYSDCQIAGVNLYARALSNREVYQLYEDPYCFMQPQMQPRFWSVPAAGGAISGDLNQTLGALTSVATGAVAVQGAVSKTLGSLTSSAQGTVAVQGILAASLGAATLSSTGSGLNNGVLAATLGALTSSSTGTVLVQGALTATLGAATLSTTGTVDVFGVVSKTLGALTVVADGVVGASAFGTLNITLGAATAAATGTVAAQGALTATLGALTALAAGQVAITGSVSATLGACTVSSQGSSASSISGTLLVTLGAAVLIATGTVHNLIVGTGYSIPLDRRGRSSSIVRPSRDFDVS